MIKSRFSHLKLAAVVAVLAITLIPSVRPSTAKNQPPPLAPAAAVSFIVRVSAETSLGQQFQVNKKGEF